ncbi:hypothetical protein M422DRAFT_254437 [Sphaerobolus stellatus SS14]|uniref:Uncharacterized protein n=1 Tax=Sphaerobolus stellatus (strain SS14) TaxID=990650 RepID=A0A0C9VKY4_SPHS4|nr:hypothetical protein M422DRAFT_254437 [Sphaerobolus stellatus SS14]
MSTATTSSKSTTATAILYKKLKDVPHLPLAVPKFTARRDPMKNNEWEGYEQAECNALIKGYWWWYDKEHDELEDHYLALVRKEAEVDSKRKSEEEKKKKSKPVAPVASGSGKNKGKGKVVIEVVDSESKANTEFHKTCVGCEWSKVKCVFTHAANSKKVACDRCIHCKTNCTYQSPQDLAVQGMLKKISKSLVNLDVKAGN